MVVFIQMFNEADKSGRDVAVTLCLSLSFSSQVNQFRQLYSKVINDKHDDVMAKFGAILAQGILDAGQLKVEGCICELVESMAM